MSWNRAVLAPLSSPSTVTSAALCASLRPLSWFLRGTASSVPVGCRAPAAAQEGGPCSGSQWKATHPCKNRRRSRAHAGSGSTSAGPILSRPSRRCAGTQNLFCSDCVKKTPTWTPTKWVHFLAVLFVFDILRCNLECWVWEMGLWEQRATERSHAMSFVS